MPHKDYSKVRLRADTPAEACTACCIPGCGRPPQRAVGNGLSLYHCRYHVQLRNRHGSLWKRTYSATALRPYRKAAESYIKAHRAEPAIAHALSMVFSLLADAGPVQRVAEHLHRPPPRKARAALARMRKEQIPPERILAIHMAVSAIVAEDPISPGGPPSEYRKVQIAKATLRQASGDHSYYGEGLKSYHRYPRSSGLFLRHLGDHLEEACGPATEQHVAHMLALKQRRYGPWSHEHKIPGTKPSTER